MPGNQGSHSTSLPNCDKNKHINQQASFLALASPYLLSSNSPSYIISASTSCRPRLTTGPPDFEAAACPQAPSRKSPFPSSAAATISTGNSAKTPIFSVTRHNAFWSHSMWENLTIFSSFMPGNLNAAIAQRLHVHGEGTLLALPIAISRVQVEAACLPVDIPPNSLDNFQHLKRPTKRRQCGTSSSRQL